MTKNNIRASLEEHGITQVEAAARMPDDVGRVGMSFIVTGKVLPTKANMKALCEMFDCSLTDLYEVEDLNLLSIEDKDEDDSVSFTVNNGGKSGRGHEGMTELRAWLRPCEKEALSKAVEELGYRSIAEWLREMIRNTVAWNKRLQIKTDGKPA